MLKTTNASSGKRITLRGLYIILVVGLISIAGFFFYKYIDLKNNPEKATNQITENLTQKIGKLVSLPNDETPTIATIEDKTKLDTQPFFKDAENGDKILIYTQAKKAIIYRESQNKIINVGPIALSAKTE